MPQAALVTGASRGVGRGIALALAESGWRVFATGRTIDSSRLPASITCLRCDHTRDEETRSAFAAVEAKVGGLELLVNNAWGGYERMSEEGAFTWTLPFWKQPMHRWDTMMTAGVRAAFVCSSLAAPRMIEQGRGLIVNISFWAARKFVGNALYGLAKAATDKLTTDLAHELRPHGVSVVSLYPGLVRTESVLEAAAQGWLDLANSESPEFQGRVIAALAADPGLPARSGTALVSASVARELGITDLDGRQPVPLTIDQI